VQLEALPCNLASTEKNDNKDTVILAHRGTYEAISLGAMYLIYFHVFADLSPGTRSLQVQSSFL